MILDTSKLGTGSWKSTVGGLVAGGLMFVNSYIQNGQHINVHDPKFWMAFGFAAWGYVQKDSNVTGGTTLASGSVPDATLHAAAENEKKAP